jgi:hypothetical protein
MNRNAKRLLALLVTYLASPAQVASQVVAEPILAGRVLLGDSVLGRGTVVLHHVDAVAQGEIDSVAVAPDGSFVMRLPAMPSGSPEEMYFASVRHDGVMYFGTPITAPVDLDSVYVIHAYDTIVAPVGGVSVAVEARSVFFEPAGNEWAITDVFQLRNDGDQTLVPREGGRVWSYPLPAGAREVSAQQEMSEDVISAEGGDIVYRAALPPGPRLFVLRYFVDSLGVAIPTPGETEMLDVLVREPAPSIEIEGLVREQSIQLEAGSTYRRFAGQGITLPQVQISPVQESDPPPVEWIAVALAFVLLGGGLLALRGAPRTAPQEAGGVGGKQEILLQIARLDEEYEGEDSPSGARTRAYEKRRAELLSRLRSNG